MLAGILALHLQLGRRKLYHNEVCITDLASIGIVGVKVVERGGVVSLAIVGLACVSK